MKKYFLLLLISLSLGFTSCSNDDEEATLSSVSIANESGQKEVIQNGILTLVAQYDSNITPKVEWKVDNEVKSNDKTFNFSSEKTGNHVITLTVSTGTNNENATLTINVYGKYRDGTFILNEGSAGNKNSHLTFISPQYEVTKEAYYDVNQSYLGDVSQDLYINNGKMYIISQGAYGDKTTMGITIANAETLEKIAVIRDEVKVLNSPTSIVATDDNNVYIRDSKGIYLFNPNNKTIALIENTARAVQTRMTVSKGKVFAARGTSIIAIQGQTIVGETTLGSTPTGILKANDGNIWVSTKNSISKLSSTDYSIIKTNSLDGYMLNSYGTPAISAKGDTFYFNSNYDAKIYSHNFDTGETKQLFDVGANVENANIVYGSVAVNPGNGDVYINTIKGYSTDYTTNTISIFNFEHSSEPLLHNLKDYTSFPGGIYFTDSFE